MKATNPVYVIDYGDGTPIVSALPISAQSPKIVLSHVYAYSGIYTVSATVFNLVSTKTIKKTVSLKSFKFLFEAIKLTAFKLFSLY